MVIKMPKTTKTAKSKSETTSFTAPPMMRMELDAVPRTGYYDSVSEFLRDAMRTLLAARKDLRIAIAAELYKEERISLGKAAEIIGDDIEMVKKLFVSKGIKLRRGTATKKELELELKELES